MFMFLVLIKMQYHYGNSEILRIIIFYSIMDVSSVSIYVLKQNFPLSING